MNSSGLARSLATLAAATTVLVATAQTPTATADAGTARAAGAMTGAPALGTCSTMTADQADAPTDDSTPVPCRQPHTAYVAAVVRLPASLDWDTVSTKDLRRVVAERCSDDVLKVLGPATWAAADRTAYDTVFFQPTDADIAAGARWLSCSIVLRHGSRLADLPWKKAPFVRGKPTPDSVARCLTKAALRTTCSAAHAWRATGTFTVKSRTRPSARSLSRTAARRCLPLVDRHQKYFRFTYPDPITWAGAGDHVVVCYSQTHV